MYGIEKTTQEERIIIENAMCGLVFDLEGAQNLLETVMEEHFYEAEQKALSSSEAEWVGSMLRIVRNALYTFTTSYYLTVADTNRFSTELYLKEAEQIKKATECSKKYNEICDSERFMDAEKRNASIIARKNIAEMDDGSAITALKSFF